MSHAESSQVNGSLKDSLKDAKTQVEGLKDLVPQQLNDEVKLATTTLKSKGISVGVAAALGVGALLVVLLFVIAVVVTLVNVLAIWLPGWLSALIVAVFFLLVAGVLALIGYRKVKKALPLTPDDAIRGIRHDIGVLKDGSAFDESTLDEPLRPKKEEKDEEAAEDKEKKVKEPAPSIDELKLRTNRRRRQIQALRDNLGVSMETPKAKYDQARNFADRMGQGVTGFAAKARTVVNPSGDPAGDRPEGRDFRRKVEKVKPIAIIAGSLVALGLIIRKLAQRG
ncbi:phage holin family protein [Glutamicibacter endophyticus]|uniref:phage holin family protein n=1 Tax=Glutamicibacter endophyticus TaxID=1522174 RepID=UPI003AEF6E03